LRGAGPLSEVKIRSRGAGSTSEVKIHLRGAVPSSEAEIGSKVAENLERARDSTRGHEPSLDGPERLLGRGKPWALRAFCPLLDHVGLGVVCILRGWFSP
jgi:hypothetical protein